jgi:predicted glycoside hydrolase/deacetylase ChbG (UPF0249 family)
VSRVLVVNADDFGRSHGINRGIAIAHDEGIVTSASAMVCWPAAEKAAELARERPSLGIGLHVDLSEWAYVNGEWQIVYQRATGESAAVAAQVETQLAGFRTLFGREPTHLDSHQHVHREEPLRSILLDLGATLGVPVRDLASGVTYRGDFYGQTGRGESVPEAIRLDALLRLIASLSPGVTEIGCHPAAEPEVGSSYAYERPEELRVLCDPGLRSAIENEGIELRSFAGLKALRERRTT